MIIIQDRKTEGIAVRLEEAVVMPTRLLLGTPPSLPIKCSRPTQLGVVGARGSERCQIAGVEVVSASPPPLEVNPIKTRLGDTPEEHV